MSGSRTLYGPIGLIQLSMADTHIDLLALGAHPDDIEIGMAATLALHAHEGWRTGLCDLTRGELGSNGTPRERVAEAEAAGVILDAAVRVNLELPDGGLRREDPEQIRRVVDIIRRLRPRALAAPYWEDRHPDHVAASELITEAVFKAGLRRYETDAPAWRPEWVCYYFINDSTRPSFALDVSAFYERKRQALACHISQFTATGADATATRLTSPLFTQLVESRDAQFGALIGARYAEGFIVRELASRPHLFKSWSAPVPSPDFPASGDAAPVNRA